MKKSLLTLTLLVGFAPVVIATGNQKAKPAEKVIADVENTDAKTTEGSTEENSADSEEKEAQPAFYKRGYAAVKAHLGNNKKWYIGGTSVAALGGLGYFAANNPRQVRRFGKTCQRFGRLGLKAALANPWRTAVVLGTPSIIAGLYYKDSVKNGWTKFSTGCSNKWNSFKGYFKKAEETSEENTSEENSSEENSSEETAK